MPLERRDWNVAELQTAKLAAVEAALTVLSELELRGAELAALATPSASVASPRRAELSSSYERRRPRRTPPPNAHSTPFPLW